MGAASVVSEAPCAVDAATGFVNNEPVQLELGGDPAVVLHVDGIVALLRQMNPKIAPERWRRLFLNPWGAERPDLGRVALDIARPHEPA